MDVKDEILLKIMTYALARTHPNPDLLARTMEELREDFMSHALMTRATDAEIEHVRKAVEDMIDDIRRRARRRRGP